MKKILVALDGSEAAQAAAAWAADLAWSIGAKIVAATVVEHAGTRRPGDAYPSDGERLLEEEWVVPLTARGIDLELAVMHGDPRTELAKYVADGDVDAVVVGTTGSGGFRGLGLGGVAHYLAHHLPCPLIAVPRVGGPLSRACVIVGADGSAANERALRWAVETADQLDGRAEALFVHSPLADVMTHTASNWTYPGEEKVRAAADRISSEIAPVEVTLASGNPVEELVRAAAVHDAAMIVVGRRGWGSVFGTVVGRVPAQLLHHAERPVAVVPH